MDCIGRACRQIRPQKGAGQTCEPSCLFSLYHALPIKSPYKKERRGKKPASPSRRVIHVLNDGKRVNEPMKLIP
jgi:hypothetical protein